MASALLWLALPDDPSLSGRLASIFGLFTSGRWTVTVKALVRGPFVRMTFQHLLNGTPRLHLSRFVGVIKFVKDLRQIPLSFFGSTRNFLSGLFVEGAIVLKLQNCSLHLII